MDHSLQDRSPCPPESFADFVDEEVEGLEQTEALVIVEQEGRRQPQQLGLCRIEEERLESGQLVVYILPALSGKRARTDVGVPQCPLPSHPPHTNPSGADLS